MADTLLPLLATTSLRAFDSPAPSPAWAEPDFQGRLAFIRCVKDAALPIEVQNVFINISEVDWVVKDLDGGHCSFLADPEALIKILEEIQREFAAAWKQKNSWLEVL